MGKFQIILLIGSLLGAIYFYNHNAWYSLLCFGLFAAVLYDAKTN